MNQRIFFQDLVQLLIQEQKIDKQEADAFLEAFINTILEALDKDKIVKIKGLGTFKLVVVEKRESIDVNTGERIEIESHSKITFIPENKLKDEVNHPFAQFESILIHDDSELADYERIDQEWEEQESELLSSLDEKKETFIEREQVLQEAEEKEERNKVLENEVEVLPPPIPKIGLLNEENINYCISEDKDKDEVLLQEEETPPPFILKLAEKKTTNNVENKAKETSTKEVKDGSQIKLEKEKTNWWKVSTLVLLTLIALVGSYYLGRLHSVEKIFETSGQSEPHKIAVEGVVNVQNVEETKREEAIPVETSLIDNDETENSKADILLAERGKKGVREIKHKKLLYKSNYKIVGTRYKHTIGVGQTLRGIAYKEYGDKQFVSYIVKYNHIENPDLIKEGTIIALPELQE